MLTGDMESACDKGACKAKLRSSSWFCFAYHNSCLQRTKTKVALASTNTDSISASVSGGHVSADKCVAVYEEARRDQLQAIAWAFGGGRQVKDPEH